MKYLDALGYACLHLFIWVMFITLLLWVGSVIYWGFRLFRRHR